MPIKQLIHAENMLEPESTQTIRGDFYTDDDVDQQDLANALQANHSMFPNLKIDLRKLPLNSSKLGEKNKITSLYNDHRPSNRGSTLHNNSISSHSRLANSPPKKLKFNTSKSSLGKNLGLGPGQSPPHRMNSSNPAKILQQMISPSNQQIQRNGSLSNSVFDLKKQNVTSNNFLLMNQKRKELDMGRVNHPESQRCLLQEKTKLKSKMNLTIGSDAKINSRSKIFKESSKILTKPSIVNSNNSKKILSWKKFEFNSKFSSNQPIKPIFIVRALSVLNNIQSELERLQMLEEDQSSSKLRSAHARFEIKKLEAIIKTLTERLLLQQKISDLNGKKLTLNEEIENLEQMVKNYNEQENNLLDQIQFLKNEETHWIEKNSDVSKDMSAFKMQIEKIQRALIKLFVSMIKGKKNSEFAIKLSEIVQTLSGILSSEGNQNTKENIELLKDTLVFAEQNPTFREDLLKITEIVYEEYIEFTEKMKDLTQTQDKINAAQKKCLETQIALAKVKDKCSHVKSQLENLKFAVQQLESHRGEIKAKVQTEIGQSIFPDSLFQTLNISPDPESYFLIEILEVQISHFKSLAASDETIARFTPQSKNLSNLLQELSSIYELARDEIKRQDSFNRVLSSGDSSSLISDISQKVAFALSKFIEKYKNFTSYDSLFEFSKSVSSLFKEIKEAELMFEVNGTSPSKITDSPKKLKQRKQSLMSNKLIDKEKATPQRNTSDRYLSSYIPKQEPEVKESDTDLTYRLFIKFGSSMFGNKNKKCIELLQNGFTVYYKRKQIASGTKLFDLSEFIEQVDMNKEINELLSPWFYKALLKLSDDESVLEITNCVKEEEKEKITVNDIENVLIEKKTKEILNLQMAPATENGSIYLKRTSTLLKKCSYYICELLTHGKKSILLVPGQKNFLALQFFLNYLMIKSFDKNF